MCGSGGVATVLKTTKLHSQEIHKQSTPWPTSATSASVIAACCFEFHFTLDGTQYNTLQYTALHLITTLHRITDNTSPWHGRQRFHHRVLASRRHRPVCNLTPTRRPRRPRHQWTQPASATNERVADGDEIVQAQGGTTVTATSEAKKTNTADSRRY